MEQFKKEIQELRAEAWKEGYQACKEGKQEFRNPFRPSSNDDEKLDRENLG